MSADDAGGADGTPTDDVVVDARGLRCPAPVLRAARAARDAAPGALLTVWWTDPAALPDLAAWARMRGHALVEAGVPLADAGQPRAPSADESDGPAGPAWATTVRLGGPPPP